MKWSIISLRNEQILPNSSVGGKACPPSRSSVLLKQDAEFRTTLPSSRSVIYPLTGLEVCDYTTLLNALTEADASRNDNEW